MAISRETIEKKSFFYGLLRPYVDLVTTTYFRTSVNNYENVPKDEIIIYAPNHQNALMDALAILATLKTQPIFLARADIFKKKSIANILTFLKILPIYRIRDGKESLENNEAIFRKTIDVLKNKNGLVILPEGTHGDKRKLKTLKKGISRIVFEAEEANDFKLNIKIVPIGLDWTHYQHFRSRLFVNFGEPINVSEYYEEYKKNAPRGLNLLRERVASELRKYMIDIQSEEYYDMYDNIRYVYLPQMIKKLGLKNDKQPNNFYAQKAIIKHLDTLTESHPEETKQLAETTTKYANLLKKLNFRHWVLLQPKHSLFGIFGHLLFLLLFFPVFLYGAVLNYIPYILPVLASKKIKDSQFVSSVRLVVSLIVNVIYYIPIIILGAFVLEPWWLKILVPVTLPFAGLFAFHYFIGAKKCLARLRYNLKTWFKNKDLIKLKEHYLFIIQKMDQITS